MFSANTNPSALLATRVFVANRTDTAEVFNRVGTGLKVPGTLQDASSYSIAQGVRTEIRAWQAVHQGLNATIGVVKVAEAAATNISDLLNDLKAKYV
jgi:flagellin